MSTRPLVPLIALSYFVPLLGACLALAAPRMSAVALAVALVLATTGAIVLILTLTRWLQPLGEPAPVALPPVPLPTIDPAQLEALEVDKAQLHAELASSREAADALTHQLEGTQQELAALTEQLEGGQQEVVDLTQQLEAKQQEVAALQAAQTQVVASQEQIARLREELITARFELETILRVEAKRR